MSQGISDLGWYKVYWKHNTKVSKLRLYKIQQLQYTVQSHSTSVIPLTGPYDNLVVTMQGVPSCQEWIGGLMPAQACCSLSLKFFWQLSRAYTVCMYFPHAGLARETLTL